MSIFDKDGFEILVYRVEWQTEIYYVDQYGRRYDEEVAYRGSWPTRELAQIDLEKVAEPDKYVKGRWRSKLHKNDYLEAGIRRINVLRENKR